MDLLITELINSDQITLAHNTSSSFTHRWEVWWESDSDSQICSNICSVLGILPNCDDKEGANSPGEAFNSSDLPSNVQLGA